MKECPRKRAGASDKLKSAWCFDLRLSVCDLLHVDEIIYGIYI